MQRQNLIRNSRWCPGPDGGPRYFSGSGTTYDRFCIDDHRTCSITQSDCMHGYDQYDPMIPVCAGGCIEWGYILRAIEAQRVELRAVFYNECGRVIAIRSKNIACRITAEFQRHQVQFQVPRRAVKVQLSLHFEGKVTACTFYAPAAYDC